VPTSTQARESASVFTDIFLFKTTSDTFSRGWRWQIAPFEDIWHSCWLQSFLHWDVACGQIMNIWLWLLTVLNSAVNSVKQSVYLSSSLSYYIPTVTRSNTPHFSQIVNIHLSETFYLPFIQYYICIFNV